MRHFEWIGAMSPKIPNHRWEHAIHVPTTSTGSSIYQLSLQNILRLTSEFVLRRSQNKRPTIRWYISLLKALFNIHDQILVTDGYPLLLNTMFDIHKVKRDYCAVNSSFGCRTDMPPTPKVTHFRKSQSNLPNPRLNFVRYRHIGTDETPKIIETIDTFNYLTLYHWFRSQSESIQMQYFAFGRREEHLKHPCLVVWCDQKTALC